MAGHPELAETGQRDGERPIWDVIQKIVKNVPDAVFEQLPKDSASQIDYYIYGLPKRD